MIISYFRYCRVIRNLLELYPQHDKHKRSLLSWKSNNWFLAAAKGCKKNCIKTTSLLAEGPALNKYIMQQYPFPADDVMHQFNCPKMIPSRKYHSFKDSIWQISNYFPIVIHQHCLVCSQRPYSGLTEMRLGWSHIKNTVWHIVSEQARVLFWWSFTLQLGKWTPQGYFTPQS